MVYDDEDDAFDENGLLRDGARYRIPVRLMDSFQRNVRKHFARHSAGPARITDQFGDGGLGLHRPGYRFQNGGNAGDAAVRDGLQRDAQAACDQYERGLVNAWRDQDNGDGDDEELEAPPNQNQDARATLERLYRERDAALSQQWRFNR
jgi:hypothetical protein